MSTGLLARGAALLVATACSAATFAQPSPDAAQDQRKLEDFLVDFAAGDVSAAGMLGLAGDAVQAVENPRNLAIALKGLGSAGSSFGISIAPARTSWAPLAMTLGTYKASTLNRLIGAAAFSYAQGNKAVSDVDMERRAFAFSTSVYLDPADDPVLGLGVPMEASECPARHHTGGGASGDGRFGQDLSRLRREGAGRGGQTVERLPRIDRDR